MNILKYFCKTAENVEIPKGVKIEDEIKPVPQTTEAKTVEPETTSDITETDPAEMTTLTNEESTTLTEDGGVVIQVQSTQLPKIPENIHKLKPASKYTEGKKISMSYLSPDRYYFIKSRISDKIVLFGKCIKFDKFDSKKVIFRLSDTNELNVFDFDLFHFYRAVPKK